MGAGRKRVDIVFEVLHYMAFDSTVMTIGYLQKNIDTDNYHIVITDNASPDGSGDRLMGKYTGDEHVTVIKNSSNSGFTRGNNFGISYIRDNYISEFIVVMNNDVMLIETSLLQKLRRYMHSEDFAVAGPCVVDEYGKTSNPVAYELPNDSTINERIEGPERLLKYDKYGLMNTYFRLIGIVPKLRSFFKGGSKRRYVSEIKRDVVLHGCMWFFSDRYFDCYEGLADKEYMYGEEETLQLCIEAAGLKSVYLPDITVLHLHQKSSKEAFSDSAERNRFVAMNQKESWKEYLKLRDELKASARRD